MVSKSEITQALARIERRTRHLRQIVDEDGSGADVAHAVREMMDDLREVRRLSISRGLDRLTVEIENKGLSDFLDLVRQSFGVPRQNE